MTVYTMLAVAYFEEPDLIRIVGPQYEEYMKITPRYIPQLCPVGKKKETWLHWAFVANIYQLFLSGYYLIRNVLSLLTHS